jgi:hypothetical protein
LGITDLIRGGGRKTRWIHPFLGKLVAYEIGQSAMDGNNVVHSAG